MGYVSKPWDVAFEPHRVFGNTYFTGTIPASSHLIDTGAGLIVIDTGYQETLYLMLESTRRLGYDIRDIKYIVHSHGHIDHAAGTRALVELTGAETFIGAGDVDMVMGKNELSWAPEFNMQFPGTFTPDHILHDGDKISLGDVTIECVATPGHTMGTMSFFWNIGTLDGKMLRAGMMGGAGLNTMTSNYIRKYGLEKEDRRSAFADSLKRCREEQVDVLIGNHVDQNDMVKKYPLLRAGQTDIFVDSSAWGAFLDLLENLLAKLLADDPL